MSENENNPAKKNIIVYACSGCSDAGEIADRVARQLTRDGAAQMSCLAGIGGRVKGLVMKAEKAERILVVDGCPLNCAAHTLRLAGFEKFEHLELHKLGIRKGSCPVTDERIADGVTAAKEILACERADEVDSGVPSFLWPDQARKSDVANRKSQSHAALEPIQTL